MKHESFAHTRLVGYVPRDEQVEMVNRLLSERKLGQGVICAGPSGSGKTCLLCKYGLEAAKDPNTVVFMHFVQRDDEAKDHKSLIWRIYEVNRNTLLAPTMHQRRIVSSQ